jgi:hypothetical protein
MQANPVYQFHSYKRALLSLQSKKKYCGFTNSNLDYLSWKIILSIVSYMMPVGIIPYNQNNSTITT